jgi:hypothetical protein
MSTRKEKVMNKENMCNGKLSEESIERIRRGLTEQINFDEYIKAEVEQCINDTIEIYENRLKELYIFHYLSKDRNIDDMFTDEGITKLHNILVSKVKENLPSDYHIIYGNIVENVLRGITLILLKEHHVHNQEKYQSDIEKDEYTYEQDLQLAIGLFDNINISSYSKPELSADKMREIRLRLLTEKESV